MVARSLRADDAGDDRHVVADHLVEEERGLGLIDQGGDVADVHRLVQIDQFSRLPQPVQELAEILFHFKGLRRAPSAAGDNLLTGERGGNRGRARTVLAVLQGDLTLANFPLLT